MRPDISYAQWFVDSQEIAYQIYIQDEDIAIASPIYPAPQITEPQAQNLAKQKFPYRQIIRGDGACYLNASLVGILNKCVNDPEKWKKFKANIARISDLAQRIINEIEKTTIGVDGNSLNRNKLNAILQVRGDSNLCTQLAKAILIPKHKELIKAYDDKIKALQEKPSLESKDISANTNHQGYLRICNEYRKYIASAEEGNFATSYEESMIASYLIELTKGMGENNKSIEIVTMNDLYRNYNDFQELDKNSIYLYNQDGCSHFDLWYSELDQICAEVESQKQQNSRDNASRDQLDCIRRTELIQIIKINQQNISHNSLTIINEIIGEAKFDDFIQSCNLETLELIESITTASTPDTTIPEASTAGTDRTSAKAPDSNTCYQLALNEIKNNKIPSSDFSTYLRQINTTDSKQRHLALFVAMYGKTQFIDPLINNLQGCFKVKDNAYNIDNTPLMWAIANANNQFAFELLSKQIDLDINFKSERFGTNALHIAIAKDYTNQDSDRKTVGVANHILVEKLITKGANPNIKTSDGFSALDIAVFRGSEIMVLAIINSPLLNAETILKALHHHEQQYSLKKTTSLLDKICSPFKAVTEHDISFPKRIKIKEILEQKLMEIAPEIKFKKELKDSIKIEVDSNSDFTKEYAQSYLLNMQDSDSLLKEIYQEVFEEKFQIKFTIPNRDSNFEIYHEAENNIIKFKTISLYNDNAKFNYNKMLKAGEAYSPKNFTKETEQEKILKMLKKAKDITVDTYTGYGLDNNFFIAVMLVASKNCGIANIDEDKFNKDFEEASKDLNSTYESSKYDPLKINLHEIAMFFSANFQLLSKEENYLF
jgi:ankyrin repeat protein